MTYTIYHSSATNPIKITDGTLDNSTSLILIGKNVSNYGQYLDQNFLYLLENFSNVTQPSSPIKGQLWYDSNNSVLKVCYDGRSFKNVGSAYASSVKPVGNAAVGDFWLDTIAKQVYVYTGTDYSLVGPPGNTTAQVTSNVIAYNGGTSTVMELSINNQLMAILSKDAFVPSSIINGFSQIRPGFNLIDPAVIPNAKYWGQAFDSLQVGGLSPSLFLRNDKNQTINGTFSVNNDAGIFLGTNNQGQVAVSTNEVRLVSAINNGLIKLQTFNNGVRKTGLTVLPNGSVSSTYDHYVGGNVVVVGNVYATAGVFSAQMFVGSAANFTDITMGNLLSTGNVTTQSSVNAVNINATGDIISYGGNIIAQGALTSASLSSNGNVTAGGSLQAANVWSTGNVTTYSNITAYGSGNSYVTIGSGGLTTTGNITSYANIRAISVNGNGGVISVAQLSSTGNISGTGEGLITGNIVAGRGITAGGNISAAGAINALGNLNVLGNLSVNGNINGTIINTTYLRANGFVTTGNGYIGVGYTVTSPGYPITVVGATSATLPAYTWLTNPTSASTYGSNVGYNAGASAAISIYASDRIVATEFNAYSDARIKDIIGTINSTDSLRFITDIDPVHYKLSQGVDDGDKFGFIAQDLVKAGFSNLVGQTVDEEITETTDADGFVSPAGHRLTVDYTQVIPLLTSAVKELHKQVQDLQAQVAALQNK
jgi:Chaperone of endosialidase